MKNTKFPEIVNQMRIHNERLQDIVDLLGYKELSQISRRLSGEVQWTIGEVEVLCKHYNIDLWTLFKRKED